MFDPARNAFPRAGPMERTEQLVAGEDLLILDYKIDGMTLAFVASRPGWVPNEINAVLLQTVEINCDTDAVRYQLEMVTSEGTFDALSLSKRPSFANSLEQKEFVDALEARRLASLSDWLTGYIAAEHSKR